MLYFYHQSYERGLVSLCRPHCIWSFTFIYRMNDQRRAVSKLRCGKALELHQRDLHRQHIYDTPMVIHVKAVLPAYTLT